MTKGIDFRTGEPIIENPDPLPRVLTTASYLDVPDHHDGDGDDDFERLIAARREESRKSEEE